jgi:hypothetical protein
MEDILITIYITFTFVFSLAVTIAVAVRFPGLARIVAGSLAVMLAGALVWWVWLIMQYV